MPNKPNGKNYCDICKITFTAKEKVCKHIIGRRLDEVRPTVKHIAKLRTLQQVRRSAIYLAGKLASHLSSRKDEK